MPSLRTILKLAPVLAIALLAVATSLEVGCSGSILGGAPDDATHEDDSEGGPSCVYGYGYRYGSGFGYGCNYDR